MLKAKIGVTVGLVLPIALGFAQGVFYALRLSVKGGGGTWDDQE